jgi:hypothetical protein
LPKKERERHDIMTRSSKTTDKDTPVLLAEISRKLDPVIAAIASSNKEREPQVKRLKAAKFKPKEIAEVLGTTPNAMRVYLHETRKTRKSNGVKVPQNKKT